MATNKERKEETRKRMGEAASRGFREHGFSGIGVDGIAKEAGVTSGAFYAHFGSKDGAFEVALEIGLDEVIAGIPEFQREHGLAWVEAFADYYLGKPHREDLACACAMTTLGPEVARGHSEGRRIYEEKMSKIVTLIAEGLDEGTPEQLRARAWSLISVLTGGLTASRSVGSSSLTEEVAAAVRLAAVAVAGRTRLVAR